MDTLDSGVRTESRTFKRAPRLAVLYPLHDTRGGGSDHVRSWLQGQTLPRAEYRVVVASTGSAPDLEREIRSMMVDHDLFVHAPADDEVALWSVAAEAAEAPWLLFTEGHCVADPGCLEAVHRWISTAGPRMAGNCSIGHSGCGRSAGLYPIWFRAIQNEWRKPGQWRRLHRSGFVLRKELLAEVGGLEVDCGQFAPALLSARFDEAGIDIVDIEGTRIVHVDARTMEDHHYDTTSHARGELRARSRADSRFCDRYFGYVPAWTNRWRADPEVARAMTHGALSVARARPSSRSWRLAFESVVRRVTPKVPLPWQRAITRIDELAVDHLPMPQQLRLARFLRAHQRVVETTRAEWLARHFPTVSPAPRGCGHWSIESLDPDGIVGAHPLEEHGGHCFRWTEPVALIRRLPPADGAHLLSIDTAGFQGDLLASVLGIVVGGRALPSSHLTVQDSQVLRVNIPAGWATAPSAGIVLVAARPGAARNGPRDNRRLGLPVASVRIEPAP